MEHYYSNRLEAPKGFLHNETVSSHRLQKGYLSLWYIEEKSIYKLEFLDEQLTNFEKKKKKFS